LETDRSRPIVNRTVSQGSRLGRLQGSASGKNHPHAPLAHRRRSPPQWPSPRRRHGQPARPEGHRRDHMP
jgi:hypothetical protein